jgi:hypothetical protein
VADFGWMVNQVKLLISQYLENLCFFYFSFWGSGRRCSPAAPPPLGCSLGLYTSEKRKIPCFCRESYPHSSAFQSVRLDTNVPAFSRRLRVLFPILCYVSEDIAMAKLAAANIPLKKQYSFKTHCALKLFAIHVWVTLFTFAPNGE